MNDWPDMRLLREYAERGNEEAFTLLISRHLAMVYHAAWRQTRQSELAEEVVQTVFTVLARKANRISRKALLSGWLFNATRLVSARAVRDEIRRQRRQAEVARMNADVSSPEPTESADAVRPLLDEMLARLPNRDREAVLARYFDGKSFLQVALAVGTTEEAAKKRVQRALEKLRGMLASRGIDTSAVALAATLETARAQALPAGLSAAAVGSVALKGVAGTATLSPLTRSTLELMKWTKIKIAAAAGVAVLLGIGMANRFHHRFLPVSVAGTAAVKDPAVPGSVAALQEEADRLRTENSQLAVVLATAKARQAQLVSATQAADRATRESRAVAASNFSSTNGPPTMRDAFVSVGRLTRLSSLNATNLSSEARKALTDAATQESLRLMQAAAEFPDMDDYSPSSAEEAADLQTCWLHGMLDLSPEQFTAVREALVKYEKQVMQENPQQKLKLLPDLDKWGTALDDIRRLLSEQQNEQLNLSLRKIVGPATAGGTQTNLSKPPSR
jgi:RNA polymerase sigma factor (sigma-70 family)